MKPFAALTCGLLTISGSVAVHAATAPGEQDSATLEEIVVTAERRDENIQKMSLSITALSGSDLAAEGKNRIEDALAVIPAVRIQDSSLTGGTPFIRGVGPALGTDPSAAVSVDGIYQSDGLFGSQYDIARVEVLRGPQGTLYGRNATAGSVNVISNDPVNRFEGFGSVQAGNYNSRRFEGMLNVPLSDTLALRGAFLSSTHDGYMSNGTNDEDLQAGRLKLKYTPSDTMSLLLAADTVRLNGRGNGSTQAPLSAHDDPWETTDLPGRQEDRRNALYGQLDVDVGIGKLSYLPSWYRIHIYGDYNLLGANGLVVSHADNTQTTHELRLASRPESKIQWLAGAYYLDYRVVSNPFAPQLAPGTHAGFMSATTTSPTETISKAVFGQLTLPVSERLRLIAGGRYTQDEKSAATTTFSAAAVGATVVDVSSPVRFKTNKFTYKAGAEFDLAADHLLYATYSTGFKAGGINDPAAADTDPTKLYQPEELKAFEVGSKNRFLDNRLQLNTSLFHYDYSNYQVFTVAFTATPPVVAVLNAASATLWGGELEGSYKLTTDDQLDLSVAYNNNRFDQFTYYSVTYPPPTGLDRSGSHLPQAPAWTEVLGYDHDFRLNKGKWSVGGQARFYSASDISIEPALDSRQPAYTLVDLHSSWQPTDANWQLTAYANNVTNEAVRMFTREISIFGIHELSIGAPRTYGVGVSAQF
ncbi:MAG: TonB-dependent receptor [Steroidobacteraceae bacterium]